MIAAIPRTCLVGMFGDARPCAHDAELPEPPAVVIIRTFLTRHGLRESRSSDQTGFFCTVEPDGEIAVRYHTVAGPAPISQAVRRKRSTAALLGCCAELVGCGYAVTLVMSPRTLALFVSGEPSPNRQADSVVETVEAIEPHTVVAEQVAPVTVRPPD